MKILVTGANGFIGSHLMRRLTAGRGGEVRGLVRETSDLCRLDGGGYDLCRGCLEEPLEEAVAGCDAVVHTAARSSDWGGDEDFFRVNVEGTVNLARACAAAGVKRLIHLSSTVVYGFSGHRLTGEDAPIAPFNHPYCRTKARAEAELQKFRDRFHLTILRPANVYGPGDLSFTFSLFAALEKGMPAFPAGGRRLTSPCAVANLAAAVERALEADFPSGEAFNVSDGADLPWRDFLALAAGELGVKPPRLPLPVGPLRLAAALLEKIYLIRGSAVPPPLTPYRIAQAARDYSFSIGKAKRLLGYAPEVSTGQALQGAVEWFRKEKKQPERKFKS